MFSVNITGDLCSSISRLEYELRFESAGRRTCFMLLYWERFENATEAIERQLEIKSWSKKRVEALITLRNPDRKSLNEKVYKDNHSFL